MSRRRPREDEPILSLDSFLDIVTNVVGVLILVAVVTVLGASDVGVSAGTSALAAPRPSAARMLFECAGDELFFVDEEGNGQRVQEAVERGVREQAAVLAPPKPGSLEDLIRMRPAAREPGPTAETIVALLDANDVGDRSHRVTAEVLPDGLAWIYTLRSGVRGEPADSLERRTSAFQRRLDELAPGGFVYFVVHDDSFEVFRRARDLARARGIAIGWHPVEGREPVRLSGAGSLGKRIQ